MLLANTPTMYQGPYGQSHAPASTYAHYYLRAERRRPVATSFAYSALLLHTHSITSKNLLILFCNNHIKYSIS